ncbi:Tol biopolymer transport system component [Microvirga flocculans]|uniref:Tol biopolymer transport system component n=1 Tax=Microvirga flocculans TaxID=217168 RepID=A0A7W6ID03_9HYPH|nr:PD40 domain-containing protein [Microvirga flocculans]MBB4039185.1 Tol biopolymer transport system component [Microvirga flocculans]
MYLTVQSVFRPVWADIISRVSTRTNSEQSSSGGYNPEFSANGRYVLFESFSNDLVPGDTNNMLDIFRKDLFTGAVTLVSIGAGSNAEPANGWNVNAGISADGRYVVFQSWANNLVENDKNGMMDVFRKDLLTGETVRVSTYANGDEAALESRAACISADGRYVFFESEATFVNGESSLVDIFRKDMESGEVTLVSNKTNGPTSNGQSSDVRITPDGRYVVFTSSATNLVEGDTNGKSDVFRKDMQTGEIVCVSVAAGGEQAEMGASSGAQITPDGRYVIFQSSANNLVQGDTNNADDIFRKDLLTQEIIRVSTNAGNQEASGSSISARITPDGRYVVFQSNAKDLVSGVNDGGDHIYLKDILTGAISCLSEGADGQGNSGSSRAVFSPDGRYVVFDSDASNLVAGDTNDSKDLFLVNLVYKANTAAIAGGRYIETTLGVGAASKATIAWGDNTSSTVTPAGGKAAFSHAYASTGIKNATVILTEGALTWKVAHTVNLGAGTLVRNTAIADTLSGGSGKDSLTGDSYANILLGGSNNDRLSAGAGNDRLDGGSGNDSLYGSSGNDRLDAGSGNDRLIGGSGTDTLTGGSGRDAFVFDDRETSSSKSKADTIADFSGRSGDRIDLRSIDANTKKSGDQNFSFIGKKDFSKAGEVRYEKTKGYTYVYLNTDSDKSAEAVIKLKGSFDLSKGWFVL